MQRTGEGDVVLMAPLLRDEVVRVGAFREALPEEAPTSLAEEFVRLLVERGIAQAVPPAPASGPPAASGPKHRADA